MITVEIRIRVDGIGVIQFNQLREPLIPNVNRWLYEVQKEYGYRDIVIEKVLADDRDITNEIRG